MGILSGAGRLYGGMLVEVDDPALGFEETAGRIKAVIEQRVETLWPGETNKLIFSLSPSRVGETRFVMIEGLHAGCQIAREVNKTQGVDGFVAFLDRLASACEQMLRRPPVGEEAPAEVPAASNGAGRRGRGKPDGQ